MPKILIIDNNRNTCSRLKAFLTKQGYRVVYSLTAKGGLDIFYRERPSLAIVDLCLSDISSLEVIQQIKSSGIPCKVIAITISGAGDVMKAVMLGADHFLPKSCPLCILAAIIRKLLA